MQHAYYEKRTDQCWAHEEKSLLHLPHLHREIEIIYVIEGGATAHADLCCEPIAPGDLFISFPEQIHYYEQSLPGRYVVLLASPDLLPGLRTALGTLLPVSNVIHTAGEEAIRTGMERILSAQGEYALTVATGHLNLLMSEVMPRLELRALSSGSAATLNSIIDHCSRHYASALTLDDVAESLHLSRYYVSRLLNGRFGLGFSDYVNLLRVGKACELLAGTDMKIADVSENVGFGTIRSFNRAFGRIMKTTPGEYRTLKHQQPMDLR